MTWRSHIEAIDACDNGTKQEADKTILYSFLEHMAYQDIVTNHIGLELCDLLAIVRKES